MLESNQRLAVIDRGLDLRANPAWCAVRELNPHLLGVGQLFWSVELPARKNWWALEDDFRTLMASGLDPETSKLLTEEASLLTSLVVSASAGIPKRAVPRPTSIGGLGPWKCDSAGARKPRPSLRQWQGP